MEMNKDVLKFKQIIEYRISKGEKLTNIAKESKISFPVVHAIMNNKEGNYRASTIGMIQDFNNAHLSVSKHEKVNEKDLVAEIENEKPKPGSQYTNEELEPIKTEKEEMTFSEMEFILKMKEFLVSTPRHIKLSITIEKNGN